MTDNPTAPIVDFLNRFAAALEIETPVDVEMTVRWPAPESTRANRRRFSCAIAASR